MILGETMGATHMEHALPHLSKYDLKCVCHPILLSGNLPEPAVSVSELGHALCHLMSLCHICSPGVDVS